MSLGGRQSFDLGNRFSLGTVVRYAGVSKTMRKRRRTPRVTRRSSWESEVFSFSCLCGYVFDDVADAYARWPNGRLCCYACA